MDQFTLFMENINRYIENPFGLLAVCTAPIIGYYLFKIYIRPLWEKKEDQQGEQQAESSREKRRQGKKKR
ncbi:hypothetical protein [Desulfogranum mediterraneum]|uniref:hypothetical protein n=1 Tax=Desulfogranum mediterraneum TaxID=160661 RepID=UPI00041CD13C|nr:hypothetical protein [Desulfogranum mediterraneum]